MANVRLWPNVIHQPLTDATDLANVDVTSYVNGALAHVNTLSIFGYDNASTATPNDITVIEPSIGPGRWEVVKPTLSAGDLLLGTTSSGGIAEEIPCTSAGRSFLAAANAAEQRSVIGAASSGANSDITSLSALSTPLSVGQGGSGASTLGPGLLVGNGTSPFSTVTAPSGAVVGTTDAQTLTNKTIAYASNTLTGVATSGANSNITSISGLIVPLDVPQGGSGASSFNAYGVIIGGATSTGALQSTTTGSTGAILRSSGTTSVPVWTTATYPATTTVNRILYSSATNVIGQITSANNSVLVTNGSGVPSISASLPSGLLITSPKMNAIFDTNNNQEIAFTATGSAVNYLTIINAATGNGPSINASGADTNVDLNLNSKGSGKVYLGSVNSSGIVFNANQPIYDSALNMFLDFTRVASAQEHINISNATLASSAGATISSACDFNANPNITITAPNSGLVKLGSTSYPKTTTANQILYSSASNTVGQITTANNGALVTNGSGVPSISSTLPAAVMANIAKFNTIVTQVFTASGTYTPSSGMLYCIAFLVGGGGGSGGTAQVTGSDWAISGGGGAGGYALKTISAATIGASQVVTVGAGGTAGAAGANAGGVGGTTSLGSICSATGGQGGAAGVNGTSGLNVNGSAGGSGSSGDINIDGGHSGRAISLQSSNIIYGSYGGASHLSGSKIPTSNTTGVAGLNYGGGAPGLLFDTTSVAANAGGAGAPGIVVVIEYCNQ
jgi:hypothetical protein